MSNTSLALPNANNRGVVNYINNARKYGVKVNDIKVNKVGMMNNRDWNIIQLLLVIEPVLSHIIAKVIVAGRRKIINAKKAGMPNSAQNKKLLNAANIPMNAINNFSAMNRAVKNAANNAKTVDLIQNAIHMVVFGLIVVNGALEVMRSYIDISLKLTPTTTKDEFLEVCYNTIILISRVVLPIILGLINKVFNRARTGTKAVALSSAAAILVATQIDSKILNLLTSKVNATKVAFNGVSNKINLMNKILKLYNPEIANAQRAAVTAAVIATRKTLRSILTVLFTVIGSVAATTTRRPNSNNRPVITNNTQNRRPAITNKKNNRAVVPR